MLLLSGWGLIVFNTGRPADQESGFIKQWQELLPTVEILEVSTVGVPNDLLVGSLQNDNLALDAFTVQLQFQFKSRFMSNLSL